MKKLSLMKSSKYAIYAKNSFVMIKTKKSEIIVITQEKVNELLIVNAMKI